MPLPRYGVAAGTFHSFTRDPSHDFGHWYHGHLTLATPDGPCASALDVDAPRDTGVAYRVVDDLTVEHIAAVRALPDGFHPLASTPASGALDYARSPMLQDTAWLAAAAALFRRVRLAVTRPAPGSPAFGPDLADRLAARLPERTARAFPWVRSNGDNALDVLLPHVRAASRIYVFGQRFDHGLGVHDVHLNQGDPVDSPWYPDNGIWQDGAVVCEHSDGRVVVWQIKFDTQVLTTDDAGHPR
ncbi:hypothetical protein ATKI12_8286 [Kitasatospora sp. Ki12]|uniref:DUF2278 family protein n=1 Tax=Kitasatospora xanthocidica TaxID=83382 RepID=UPI00167827F0|nr:DUF2278 family protein [Kitasatospora xanthocidica]GHF88635.1 hypothetical protein GCM10018790_77580 [Kitasatospora xanthocidica]